MRLTEKIEYTICNALNCNFRPGIIIYCCKFCENKLNNATYIKYCCAISGCRGSLTHLLFCSKSCGVAYILYVYKTYGIVYSLKD